MRLLIKYYGFEGAGGYNEGETSGGGGGDGGGYGSLIGGVLQAGASIYSAYQQGQINEKQLAYNWDMYRQLRADALADRDFNNWYNSPAAQMARFKAAGLNPNLIYGRGDAGNSQPVRSSSALPWSPKAPDYSGVAQSIGNALSIKTQQAQLQNLEAQNKVLLADAELKQKQAENTGTDTERIKTQIPQIKVSTDSQQFDLDMKRILQPINIALQSTSAQQAEMNLSKTAADITFTLDQNARAAALQGYTIKQMLQNIAESKMRVTQDQAEIDRIRAQIRNIDTSTELNQLDINLKKIGLQPHDNVVLRVAGQLAHNLGITDSTGNIKIGGWKAGSGKSSANAQPPSYDDGY